ncbi:hypothetical protein ACFFX1_24105 [Dactylosporangium sucinum]|uniref:Polymerase/histidinol phosphatase N-terminal domain-containing protein n=1 Tax=Dactylosporangium sucinum TaxID=1424081 RepID=A0A917TYG4_9ACTN|nr:hypothetical protein [Dactylosporangium sucinum]GGM43880.1 hypothetical protein GCM10007977_051820 [Dactylosporangium sucinum]
MDPEPRLTRRGVLAAAALPLVGAAPPVPGPGAGHGGAAPQLRPVSMAMHIHGPFSEGLASYSAHFEQARRHGVDVIWWTDHDFRIAAFAHRAAVHFDGAAEPERGLAWTWTTSAEGKLTSSAADFVASPHSPPDGPGKALRLSAAGAGILWYQGNAWNATANACIADTTLTLDVLPETLSGDGALLLDVQLSHHPARGGRPAGILRIRYRIGAAELPGHSASGTSGTVSRPVKNGLWQRFTFVPRDDVARLWPDVVPGDNALTGLRIGVQRAGFVVDRLTFDRSRRAGQAGEQLRAEVIAAAARDHPGVTHFRAMEMSLVRHVNWFGGDQTFPPFPMPPVRDNDPALTRSMVRFLHAHGGLTCWNHPMDVATREELVKLMIASDFLGCDLVEIGRKPLDDLLWAFDVAARNALFFTAVGSSDDHDGIDWLTNEEHFVTYVWARSTAQADLLAALRAGAAWFTDLARYRGELDLRVGGVSHLGAVLIRSAPVTVSVVATKLPRKAVVEVVSGPVDEAAAVPSTTVSEGAAVTVRPGRYVRVQVRLATGEIVGASNPLWVLARKPKRPVPAARAR